MARVTTPAENTAPRRITGAPGAVVFLQAVPSRFDPPGTVRWVVVQPDGTRIPAGARAVDDLSEAA